MFLLYVPSSLPEAICSVKPANDKTPICSENKETIQVPFSLVSKTNKLERKILPKYDPCGKLFILQAPPKVLSPQHLATNHLKKNYTVRTGEKPFKCKTCTKLWDKKSAFMTHLKSHKADKMLKCPGCEKDFKSLRGMASHIWISHYQNDNQYKCESCGKEFNTFSKWKHHNVTHTGEKPFECEHCGSRFTQKGSLIRHVQTHDLHHVLNCSKCGRDFKSFGGLTKHRTTCVNGKIYQCHLCVKTFSSASSLKRHYLVHTGERPFECEICGKFFTDQYKVKNHLHHVLNCSKCGKVFKSFGMLIKHRTTCVNGKIYQCHLCVKTFSSRPGLKRHYLVHTGERPFECEICGKFFTHKYKVKNHSCKEKYACVKSILNIRKNSKVSEIIS